MRSLHHKKNAWLLSVFKMKVDNETEWKFVCKLCNTLDVLDDR